MLVEKEVIRPGCYWYRDETTGVPRKLVVTPELTKYWSEQGAAMLSAGLTIPVPCEHDFDAHPMTPSDRLKNNAGWVKEYRLHDGRGNPGDRLFSVIDVQDEELAKKLPSTIRWTSPWINTFTDGQGKEWKNVISHLALTTRPRIVEQAPFGGAAAALSMATSIKSWDEVGDQGLCLSIATRLATRRSDQQLCPRYPIAFSMLIGAALGDDFPPKAKKKPGAGGKSSMGDDPPTDDGDEFEGEGEDADLDGEPSAAEGDIDLEPYGDPAGDVKMEELLCDLLGALGIHVEHAGDPEQFKRELYNAAMTKIHEGQSNGQDQQQQPNRTNPPGMPPNNPKKPGAGGQPNPLVQQEQQPMFMSLQDIHKITDPTMKAIALSMYTENQKIRADAEADRRKLNSLNDSKLKEENAKRAGRVHLLSRLSPRVRADLDAMLAMPSMALSMGDGGAVNDPMAQTLAVLEKGLADLPRLLTTDTSALSVHPQPQDADVLTEARADEIADGFARQMGCPPQQKQAS